MLLSTLYIAEFYAFIGYHNNKSSTYTIIIVILTLCINLGDDCMLTRINGHVKHNQGKKKTTFTFSSDDDLRTTYRCKLDKKDFQQCEF